MGDLALVAILFVGGLDTEWRQIQPVLATGITLATVGVGLTALLIGTFAWFMLGTYSSFNIGPNGITWAEGLLIGTIVSSTDAAAVFSILRSSNLSLKGQLQPLLELEAGSNDPMAVLLTTNMVKILTTTDFSVLGFVGSLLQQLVVGSLLGYSLGRGMVWVVNRIQLDVSGLYPITTLALLLVTFGVTNGLGGNGFLAVYIAGIVAPHPPRSNPWVPRWAELADVDCDVFSAGAAGVSLPTAGHCSGGDCDRPLSNLHRPSN
ncbi:MAG: cation:proton antiporter [Nodosilinea sp.]